LPFTGGTCLLVKISPVQRMQGSLHTKQLVCLFYSFFVSGLRSEHCNLPQYALAESGPNMANRHTTHSACSVTQRSQCKGSPEHALGHVVEVGCMWWFLPSHSPFSALCCTQSILWNSIQTTLGLVLLTLPTPRLSLPDPPWAPRARARRLHPHSIHNPRESLPSFPFPFLSPPMMRTLLSFAVSTLAPSSYIRVLLQCQMPIFPLHATPEPIRCLHECGPLSNGGAGHKAEVGAVRAKRHLPLDV
jgi:hypothetical protein